MSEYDKLAALSEAIAKHAREVIGRQWAEIHLPALKEILGDPERLIAIGNPPSEIPVKTLLHAIQTDYLDRTVPLLIEQITVELVDKAYRKIED